MELIAIGTIGYMLVTFPYALAWHMGLFRKHYERWNYFGKDPSPAIGLLSMVFQGIILSYFYGELSLDHSSIHVGIRYSLQMGIFFWSCHVVAAMAKHTELRNRGYFMMETVYMIGQFTLFGILISQVHRFFA